MISAPTYKEVKSHQSYHFNKKHTEKTENQWLFLDRLENKDCKEIATQTWIDSESRES